MFPVYDPRIDIQFRLLDNSIVFSMSKNHRPDPDLIRDSHNSVITLSIDNTG